MDLGPHATFIWLCYLSAGLVIGGLIAVFWFDGRRLARELAQIESRDRRQAGSSSKG